MRGIVSSGTHVMLGNHAIAEGAIAAGCRFCAGYPITPASEIIEKISERLPEVNGIFIQMEDEIASISSVVGASLAGAKAMTATSGPGFSLMQEWISAACALEVPLVIVDVQRGSPSTGQVSEPQQGDVMQARWGGNGDYEVIALAPATCQEMFDFAIDAFNLSEIYRVPVIILADALVSHMREKVVIPKYNEIRRKVVERRRPDGDPKKYIPYTYDDPNTGELRIPPPPQFGTKYYPLMTWTATRDEMGVYREEPEANLTLIRRICDKIRNNVNSIVRLQTMFIDDADLIVVAYGTPARTALRAVKEVRAKGIKAGFLRLVTVWPFGEEVVRKTIRKAKKIVVPEINYGQLYWEIERVASKEDAEVFLVPQASKLHEPNEIVRKILEVY